LSKLSPQDLEEWQGNPVTCLLRDNLGRMLARKRAVFQSRYWAGNPVPEECRLALVALEEWHEDFFSASFEDVMTVMEMNDGEMG
jgi:hypothetical protein